MLCHFYRLLIWVMDKDLQHELPCDDQYCLNLVWVKQIKQGFTSCCCVLSSYDKYWCNITINTTFCTVLRHKALVFWKDLPCKHVNKHRLCGAAPTLRSGTTAATGASDLPKNIIKQTNLCRKRDRVAKYAVEQDQSLQAFSHYCIALCSLFIPVAPAASNVTQLWTNSLYNVSLTVITQG